MRSSTSGILLAATCFELTHSWRAAHSGLGPVSPIQGRLSRVPVLGALPQLSRFAPQTAAALRTAVGRATHPWLDLRQVLLCLANRLLGILEILELPGEVLLVRTHVEMSVAREVEEDHLFLPRLLAFLCGSYR